MGLAFDEIRKYVVSSENILALNKEGQIIVLDLCDREDTAKRVSLLKKLI